VSSLILHNVDSTVWDKLIATSRDGQNMSGYLLNHRSIFNENMCCVMFVICLLDIMWGMGVTGNPETCQRFNVGEFSSSLASGGLLGTWVDGAC